MAETLSHASADFPDTAELKTQRHRRWIRRALRALPLLGAAYHCVSISERPTAPMFSRIHTIAFMADLLPLQTIWITETLRQANSHSPMSIATPAIWGILSQVGGIETISPIYYFLHYVFAPVEIHPRPDDNAVAVADAKAIIPALTCGYGIPILAILSLPSLESESRLWAIRTSCKLFPVWTVIFHRAFRAFIARRESTQKGGEESQRTLQGEKRTDLYSLRHAFIFSGAASATLSLFVRYVSGLPWLASGFSFRSLTTSDWCWAQLFSSLSLTAGLFWEVLHWSDLKREGKTSANWFEIGRAICATTLFLGPNVAVIAGWTCREEAVRRCPRKRDSEIQSCSVKEVA